MKRISLILLPFLVFSQSCIAQDLSILDHPTHDASNTAHDLVSNYIDKQPDQITLNSIIEVNGIVTPSKNTYGYIRYVNDEGVDKKCLFEHLGGIMIVSKKDFDEILKLPDSTQVEVAICLQSPVCEDWCSYWDMVMVKGTFDARRLSPTRNRLSPCFHFLITAIGKENFKIQLHSWGRQSSYYSTSQCQLSSRQKKRLDRKEKKIYKISDWPNIWGRKLW